jgi:hypothetical protein
LIAMHIMKLPMTESSPSSYFLTSFLSTLSSFLECERPSFRPVQNRIKGKIIVTYILITSTRDTVE